MYQSKLRIVQRCANEPDRIMMSKLFLTDTGRVLKDHNEDITRWRWARKVLKLPAAAAKADADLWVMASIYKGNRLPLRVSVNGKAVGDITPYEDGQAFRWYRVPVTAKVLRVGDNTITFACDAPAMSAWKLAVDGSCKGGGSAISFDRGKTWNSERLGVYNVLSGEYVVRLRSHAKTLNDAKPRAAVYADAKHPKLADLRAALPKAIVNQRDPRKQVFALRTWVATRWSHDPFGPPYAPWDAATILDWAKHDRGHSGKGKVAMCVHFAVVFASFATALGHRARCVAITGRINGMAGHFVAEVFDQKESRWLLHDTNYDVHYAHEGKVLSAVELCDIVREGKVNVKKLVRKGRGMPTKPARVLRGFNAYFATGESYQHIAVWRRMDFITDPAQGAAHHGSVVYSETDWVWYTPTSEEMAMFPLRVSDAKWFA